MPVQTTVVDTRTIQVPIPADPHDTEALGDFVVQNVHEGYVLSAVSTIQGGDQRDPINRGLRLTMKREP